MLPVYHTPGGSKTHFSEMLEYVVSPAEMAAAGGGVGVHSGGGVVGNGGGGGGGGGGGKEEEGGDRNGGDDDCYMFSERGKGWTAHVMSRAGEGLVQPTVVHLRGGSGGTGGGTSGGGGGGGAAPVAPRFTSSPSSGTASSLTCTPPCRGTAAPRGARPGNPTSPVTTAASRRWRCRRAHSS